MKRQPSLRCRRVPTPEPTGKQSTRLAAAPLARRFCLPTAHCPLPTSARRGFTMMELLLVLFVIIAVCGLAWPSIQHGYDTFKLKRAAEQVVTAFGHARVQAMTKGITEVFRLEPNTPKYTIDVLVDDTAPPDADTTTSAGSGASGTSSMTAGHGGASSSSPGSTCGQLPDGFTFTNVDRATDNRTASTENQLSAAAGSSSSAPPIMFFADGSSTEAAVTIADKNGLSINVTLRGLTSFARVSEITRGGGPGK